MCILDLSKTLMYDFHHNYITPKYVQKAKLLYTDTDSLIYKIETEDFFKDISSDVEQKFDTSDYPKNHPSGIRKKLLNKKVFGTFKDETSGEIIQEFVGLRSKLYSFRMFEQDEHKTCKGIKKNIVKETIIHEDFKQCLFGGGEQYRTMNVMRRYRHKLYSEEVNKIALSADDDKRVIMG